MIGAVRASDAPFHGLAESWFPIAREFVDLEFDVTPERRSGLSVAREPEPKLGDDIGVDVFEEHRAELLE
jgi:hypothetical protein